MLNSYVKILSKSTMVDNSDEIIDQLLADESNNGTSCIDVADAVPSDRQYKKERLVALVAEGQTEVYLGKTYSIDQTESFQ